MTSFPTKTENENFLRYLLQKTCQCITIIRSTQVNDVFAVFKSGVSRNQSLEFSYIHHFYKKISSIINNSLFTQSFNNPNCADFHNRKKALRENAAKYVLDNQN